jgi:S1-C subfamily serine protease
MQFLSALGGIKPNFEVQPRGFLGAELAAATDQLVVKSVLAGGPADRAGLKAGDRIEAAKGKSVRSAEELLEAVKKLLEGASVKLSVKRGDDTKDITVELGRGL